MSSSVEQIQILYEISMSIGASLDLRQMLRKSLSTFLKKLNCSAGGVYFLEKGDDQSLRLEKIHTIPRRTDRNKACQAARQHVPTLTTVEQWAAFSRKLPISGQTGTGSYFHILELPEVGLMIVIKNGKDLDPFVVKSLKPLLLKLAGACKACIQNNALEEAHDNAITINLELKQSHNDLHNTLLELRRVTSRNQAMLNAIPDSMFYLNRDGEILDRKVISDNDLSSEVSEKGTINQNLREILPPDIVASTLHYINKTLDSNTMQVFEYQLPVRQGRRNFEARLVVSGPNETLAIIRDITQRKQTETALTQSEEKYRAVVEQSVDCIFLIDVESRRVLEANSAFQSLLGYTSDEIVNLTLYDFVFHDRADIDQRIREILTGGNSGLGERRYRRKDDILVDVEVGVSLISYGGKKVMCVVSRDITERVKATEALRESEERLKSTISSMDDLVFVLDKSGVFLDYYQPPQRDELSVPPELFLGNSFEEILQPHLTQLLKVAINVVIDTGTVQQFDYNLDVAGKVLWFSAKVSMRQDSSGEFDGVTVVARDITEQRELDKMRDEFVSTVSHELRTPLASIMGFIETILGGRPGPLTEIQQRFLQNSYKSAERLLKLIEELLIISRIQQGILNLDKRSFYPTEAVQNVQEMMASLVNDKSLSLEIHNTWPLDEIIKGDRDRLEQVITNLISNAIKFTPEEGQVHVYSHKQDGCWHFKVEDTGIGIPEADIPRLFQRFYRAGNATEAQIQGAGLGLYVCKAIVEEHGGQIGLESKPGAGTVVWFTIPITE